MNRKTENIRLKELHRIYYDKLQKTGYGIYNEQLHNQIVKPEELDTDILLYFRKTLPSLQEFYSKYASQWEYYHEIQEATDKAFYHFLKNSAYPLAMRYNLVDLNVKYYIDRFETLKPRSHEWKRLRDLFMDKWFNLLSNNEVHYQIEHIDSLCADFYKIHIALCNNLPVRGGSRLIWLLRNHKHLAEQILEYDELIRKSPAIRELIEVLGKKHDGKQKKFRMTAGIRREKIITHGSKSDISGITVGNDLNSLLPIEYCYLSDKSLQPLFFERFIERKLQLIDYKSQEYRRLDEKKVPGFDISEETEGPFIVCIDTSGSMAGRREQIAKSALLAIAQLTEQQHRKCFIIIFSDDIECIEIADFGTNFDRLVDFLCQSFHGGTDLSPAINYTIDLILKEEYQEADVVIVSDFEFPPMNKELQKGIHLIKENETRIYGLSMGDDPEQSFIEICDRCWKVK
ncbi:VWA domain-containing protein [Bacteroides sp. 224]|uniref:VWA domain-containing protein n=1 Tax=Bacteroides sp. 224 TaxID=2302936 RepID=UPI0019403661|nr:VWA domain-containing protein [Bacteroides sp. 224]NDV66329.1 VWA domain-containing protein [Bacteroides sp. 224]